MHEPVFHRKSVTDMHIQMLLLVLPDVGHLQRPQIQL
jgi:hypothetical protein